MEIDFNVMREPGFFLDSIEKTKNDIAFINKYGWKEVKNCPICGTVNSHVFLKTDYADYVQCKICDCIYSDTIPVTQNMGRFTAKSFTELETSPAERKRVYRMKRFGLERVELLKQYKDTEQCSLLDIGCHTGFFLETAKPFFKTVEGQEIDTVTSQYVQEKYGIHVYNKDIKDIQQKFDVITAFDVLEHVERPLEFLLELKSHLNPNGIIMVFTTCYDSVSFRVIPAKHHNHLYPSHLVFYSFKTALYLAERLNMETLMLCTRGMDFFDITAYERDLKGKEYDEVLNRLVNDAQTLADESGKGNSLRMVLC